MFAGIEELTLKASGYLLWRGQEVEHYDHPHDPEYQEKWETAAREIARRCRHLEALGVPIRSSSVIWCWSWFETMTPNDPLKALLAQSPSFYQEGITKAQSDAKRAASVPMPEWTTEQTPTGRIGWTIGRNFWIWDPEKREAYISRFRPNEDGVLYHALEAAGWHLADCGQAAHLGTCYAELKGIRSFLAAHDYPTKKTTP